MYKTAYIEINDEPRLKCRYLSDLAICEGNQCIIKIGKILEFGSIVSFPEEGDRCKNDGKLPMVVRRATLQDRAGKDENILMSKMAVDTCIARVEKYKLPIKIVNVRYSFDRTVLRISFTADDRVDFREMIKDLTGEFSARIEMKQIGVRDEAGIIGGLGLCGRKICCCSWLHHFDTINVKMAKTQGLSLNPCVISGMCGRLKCCLRYEYDHYKDIIRHMPKVGANVQCCEGDGCIISRDILAKRVVVALENERIIECDAENVKATWSKRKKRETVK